MNNYKTEVSNTIKQVLKSSNYSMRSLAKEIGCPTTTVFRIVHNKVLPDLETVKRICHVLELNFTIRYNCFTNELKIIF